LNQNNRKKEDRKEKGERNVEFSGADQHSARVQMRVYIGHAQYGSCKFTAGSRSTIIPQQYCGEELI